MEMRGLMGALGSQKIQSRAEARTSHPAAPDLALFTAPPRYGWRFGCPLRVERRGEPWFVLKDVCDVLGIGNSRMVLDRLEADEKGVSQIDTLGGVQSMNVINESGLYSVILRSDKPEAKPFRKWVTSEVIPSIRRTGSYQKKQLTPAEQLLAQAGVLVEQERRIAALEQSAEQTRKGIALIAAPAATGKDTWQDETGHAIRQMCKEYSLNYQTTTGDLYRELEERAGCDLEARKRNLQKRLRTSGATAAECKAVSKLTVIARNPQLREIFSAVVQRRAATLCSFRTPSQDA